MLLKLQTEFLEISLFGYFVTFVIVFFFLLRYNKQGIIKIVRRDAP